MALLAALTYFADSGFYFVHQQCLRVVEHVPDSQSKAPSAAAVITNAAATLVYDLWWAYLQQRVKAMQSDLSITDNLCSLKMCLIQHTALKA